MGGDSSKSSDTHARGTETETRDTLPTGSQVKCIIPISQRAAKAVRAKTLSVLVVFCGAASPVFRLPDGLIKTNWKCSIFDVTSYQCGFHTSHRFPQAEYWRKIALLSHQYHQGLWHGRRPTTHNRITNSTFLPKSHALLASSVPPLS